MSARLSDCLRIEANLIAAATGDAIPEVIQQVERHIRRCAPCNQEFQRYGVIKQAVNGLRNAPHPSAQTARAQEALRERLADLRGRLITYRIFPSPLGRLLIARSEQGVSLVEFLEGRGVRTSRLSRLAGVEAAEGGSDMETLCGELLDYLAGRRTQLDWSIDLRLARSEFHRTVLQATARIPYGAITSYTGIAREIGAPSAMRAVAQALRWNPVPIVVPCHRVVGASGSLTGYAGNKILRKQRLLSIEGVPTAKMGREVYAERESMYVRDRSKTYYCLPTCRWVSPDLLSRLTFFGSRKLAEGAGLAPCTTCRPDIHPISRSGC